MRDSDFNIIFYFIHLAHIEVSGGAGAQSVTENMTGCGFDALSRHIMLIFPFLHSGVEGKSGVKFYHALPLEFRGKWGMEYHIAG